MLDNKYFPPKEPKLGYEFTREGGNGWGAEFVYGHIKVSRRKFPVTGYKYGWGNWCWDLVLVTPEVAIDLVNYLKELDVFQPETGETRWFNYFEREGAVFDRNDKIGWIRMLEKWGYQRP